MTMRIERNFLDDGSLHSENQRNLFVLLLQYIETHSSEDETGSIVCCKRDWRQSIDNALLVLMRRRGPERTVHWKHLAEGVRYVAENKKHGRADVCESKQLLCSSFAEPGIEKPVSSHV